MIYLKDKALCCGCGACEQICKKKCIQMVADEEGFLYPQVDIENCTSCNACQKVCPLFNDNVRDSEKKDLPYTVGGWHKHDEIRYDSSSGGAFTLFAEYILREGGTVVGCGFDKDMHAVHMLVNTEDELSKIRGAKYVQSCIGHSYINIKECLRKGRKVLFVGTPCQAAGLYSFIGEQYRESLFIIDFICHGVPSPKIFNEFILAEQEKHGCKLIIHRFRNKDYGWNQTGLQLGSYSVFENGASVRRFPAMADPFMNGFLGDIYLRPSCYNCKFKAIPKNYADITIADFWGVNKIDKELNDKKGTSLVLINTEKGKSIWEQVKENFYYHEVDLKGAVKKNSPLLKSAKISPDRRKFFEDYYVKGYKYVEKKYMTVTKWMLHKIRNTIRMR